MYTSIRTLLWGLIFSVLVIGGTGQECRLECCSDSQRANVDVKCCMCSAPTTPEPSLESKSQECRIDCCSSSQQANGDVRCCLCSAPKPAIAPGCCVIIEPCYGVGCAPERYTCGAACYTNHQVCQYNAAFPFPMCYPRNYCYGYGYC